ncbi:hypothetical protein [Halalkalibacter akibai]|uniref:Uncharacterized protein n=1 Tax=Halalkalibacter akibai (strain ATCC 43226 / DSM 21942 / CIP 109018 / JCM 9157 / 1139) TaxID=1236973 RepID=W4QTL8_HALA3|nr:hypothetical protein [Halalkalibacter akibai]GAE35505.1 hypothetical protein JCM9157_2616 [Halalkalibacter akibai JCM 9157]
MNFDLTTIYNDIPDFKNHDEASSWFKNRFGDQFVLKNYDTIEGEKVYYYHVIKNEEVYHEYMESLASPEHTDITSPEPFESYSTVEITEDGGISLTI